MTIIRSDLDTDRVDLSGVETGERMKPIHPGEILREEFMEPLGLSANRLARHLGVPVTRISEILHGRRSITADTALRLSRLFGTSPEFWINLQSHYDLEIARRDLGEAVKEEVRPLRPAA